MANDTDFDENLASAPGHHRIHDLIDRAIPVLAIFCLIFYVVKLVASLHEVYFWSDECVHAYVSSVIYKTHSLPWVLPDEIYGSWEWSYPPLFHVLSAFVLGLAGKSALPYVNVTLLAFFLVCFLILLWRHYGRNEAVIASLLLILSPSVAINSIRFITEMMSMVLAFFSFYFLLHSLKDKSRFFAVLSGVATATLLLCEQIGVVVLGFYILLLFWALIRKTIEIKPLSIVIVISGTIYLSYLALALINQINPLDYLALFSKKAALPSQAEQSFRHNQSSFEEFCRLFLKGNGIVLTASFLLPLDFFITRITRFRHEHYIFFLLIFLSLAMVAWHITNARNTITLIPALTLLVAYSVCRIVRNPMVLKSLIALLILFSFQSTQNMEDYRELSNAPAEIRKMMETISNNASWSQRVFGIYPFGVIWHTGRQVMWVHPDLRSVPIELVDEEDVDRFYGLLKLYGIELILVDISSILPKNDYFERSYTGIFISNCEKLKAAGKILEIEVSDDKRYLLMRVV